MPKKNVSKVLVVDDDPLILDLVKELLSSSEYQPILASSGVEALEIAKKHTSIDLLLTDIMMPGITGIDLAKQFSTLYPHVKILFMSGFTLPSSLYSIAGKGVAFLQKPFRTDTLIAKMKFVLS